MLSHVMVGSNDIDRSKTFYDALFAAIGGKPGRVDPKGRLSYMHKGAAFMVSKPIDGAAASGPCLPSVGRVSARFAAAAGEGCAWAMVRAGPIV